MILILMNYIRRKLILNPLKKLVKKTVKKKVKKLVKKHKYYIIL